jgi:peroxiredoxin Q/BCP
MEKGEKVIPFSLKDENGETINSKDLEGIRYVLFFYSEDDTPGCTKENCEFTELYPKFQLRNVPLIGVSGDSVESHKKFKEKYQLKTKLLSDPGHEYAAKCGAWGKKKLYGREVTGTIRSTFLVGKDGTIEEAWHNVKATGHAQRVLDGTLKHYVDDQPKDF